MVETRQRAPRTLEFAEPTNHQEPHCLEDEDKLEPMDQSNATRVVLADDNGDVRSQVADGLRARGYDVTEMSDGDTLLELVSSRIRPDGLVEGVDIVVSDIRMPGLSGMDVLVGLRRLQGKTPVILMTGFGNVATQKLAHAFGAVAVINKPIDLKILTRVIGIASN
jgi:DNA-binding response OmpR family regulator